MKSLEKKKQKRSAAMIFKKNISGWVLILPSVFLLFLIVWRPVGMAFYYSLFRLQGMKAVAFVGLRNFRDVITDTAFCRRSEIP